MRTRGFTIMEMMVVLGVATILTTAGFVGLTQVIKEARYRADRARLYVDLRDARDRAKRGMNSLTVAENPLAKDQVTFRIGNSCNVGPIVTMTYPAIDFGLVGGDRALCNQDAGTGQLIGGPPPPGIPPYINFKPMGTGPMPGDEIAVANDGAVVDSWNEFPNEGCLEANPGGDPDNSTRPCGD